MWRHLNTIVRHLRSILIHFRCSKQFGAYCICQYFHSKLFIWSVKYLWLFKNLRTIFRFQIKYGRSCMRTFSPSVHFIATRHLWQLWIIRLCNFIFYWSQNIDDCDGFAKKWEQNPAIFLHIRNISIILHVHYI